MMSSEGRLPAFTDGLGERLTTGTVAGLAAGLVFLLANMGYATTQDLPALAPTYDISTIFHGQDMPDPSPENAVVGLVTHVTLSLAFGIVFALLAVPFLSRWPLLMAGGIVYGLVLYVVNFQILGRAFFPWFTNPMAPTRASRSSSTPSSGSYSRRSSSPERNDSEIEVR
jgi:hypothetical protein